MLADKINSETDNLTENDELKASLEKVCCVNLVRNTNSLKKLVYCLNLNSG